MQVYSVMGESVDVSLPEGRLIQQHKVSRQSTCVWVCTVHHLTGIVSIVYCT